MNVEDFKRDLAIVESVRSQVLMLVGLFGGSGGGKTVTAIIWAVGMVGPDAKIGVIDTEQKRSTIAADAVEEMAKAHYRKAIPKIKTIHISAPFHPLKYVAAMQMLADEGCKAIVVDSMSHAWAGEGGYLELKEEALQKMAGDDWKKREACAMAAAARVKPHTHGKLFNAVTQCPVPLILCFRGVDKTRMGKGKDGKMEISKDDFSTPIQESNLIFEMLISGEVFARDGIGGYCSFRGPNRKHTHPTILSLLPKEEEQFHFSHGQAIARWCAGSTTATPASGPANEDQRRLKALKVHLFKLTTTQSGGTAEGLQQWLWDEALLDFTKQLSELTADELENLLPKVEAKLVGVK